MTEQTPAQRAKYTLRSSEDAHRIAARVAEYLARQEPLNPTSYLVRRALELKNHSLLESIAKSSPSARE